MRMRCAAANTHLILPTKRSAGFRWRSLSETLSSPLEARQTPWFSSWSSCKRTTHLFRRPSCSRRILTSCAGRKSPTSPSEAHLPGTTQSRSEAERCETIGSPCSATYGQWNHNCRRTGSWPPEHSSRLNWVAHIPPMLLLSAVGIIQSYQSYR